jgi:hypothetical protein
MATLFRGSFLAAELMTATQVVTATTVATTNHAPALISPFEKEITADVSITGANAVATSKNFGSTLSIQVLIKETPERGIVVRLQAS